MITRPVLVITLEADHATAIGGVIGITTTGIDTTRGGAPALMTGTGGGPHEGPPHLVDQRTIIEDGRHHTILGVQHHPLVTGSHPPEGEKTGDFLQDAHLLGLTTGREDQPTVVAAAVVELEAVPPGRLCLESKLQLLDQLLRLPLLLPLRG